MIEEYYRAKEEYKKISGGRLRSLLSLLGDLSHKTLLDIGCGEGILGRTIKGNSSARVIGIDISPLAVNKATKVLDRALVVDIENEDRGLNELVGEQIDAVVISEVLEHLFFPEKVLRALRDSVGKDVPIVISVPNVLFWKNRLRILLGHFEYTDHGLMERGHIHFFSWRSFKQMIKAEGFEICGTMHHVPTRALRPFANIIPGLAAFQFIVRIKKDDHA